VFVEPDKLKSGWNRETVMSEVNRMGVPCFSGSCSEVYLEKNFQEAGLAPAHRLPIAMQLGQTSLMFLVHPTLTEQEMEKTVGVIHAVMDECSL
jgi:dTDP-4-amino-4,6-dideoxygalactose transaminase